MFSSIQSNQLVIDVFTLQQNYGLKGKGEGKINLPATAFGPTHLLQPFLFQLDLICTFRSVLLYNLDQS